MQYKLLCNIDRNGVKLQRGLVFDSASLDISPLGRKFYLKYGETTITLYDNEFESADPNPVKEGAANGVTGVLYRDTDGETFFRIYAKNGDFRDYKLNHNDLRVTISDADAHFYGAPSESHYDGVLDHSPATLVVG